MTFVLDIGTRSIIGLLGTLEDEQIIIHHVAMELHKKRVMYDGQIHDIDWVVEIVKKVKSELERKSGLELKKVSIAAAGRALKTFQTHIERNLDKNKEIDNHILASLEIEAIQEAQRGLEKESTDGVNYLCVGHTVLGYYLNGSYITNPIGHRGESLKIKILATFLPDIVVNSLYTVMEKVDLEVDYITLEPIAAIEVAVPENMRLLNIALVDIGAGTADIAITKDGGVVGYGMTSIAGDEITEELVRKYLLDFDTAEILKCNLNKREIQSFTDVIGIKHDIDTKEILENIKPAIEMVAKEIADNIILHNTKPTSVVFLIGGGSQIPYLDHLVADYLQIPRERVVVRDLESIQNLKLDDGNIYGPESITPIGILVKALKNISGDYIEVLVNGKKLKLLKTQELKIRDVLLSINFNPRDLIPKKGDSIEVLINGEKKIFYGQYGEMARILIGDREVSVDEVINQGDEIYIQPATVGESARVYLKDLLDSNHTIFIGTEKIPRFYDIKVNDVIVEKDYLLKNGDKIEYKEINNIESLCKFLDIDFEKHIIYANGKKTDLYDKLKNNMQIIIDKKANKNLDNEMNKNLGNSIEIIYNGKPLVIEVVDKELIFVDIFNYIDFDRSQVKGKLVLEHNDRKANYTTPIKNGDKISIYWE